MSYDTVGFVIEGETLCFDCCPLTGEEMRILQGFPDFRSYAGKNWGTMNLWPRRTDTNFYDEYDRDDEGEIIFDEDVVVTEEMLPRDRGGRIRTLVNNGDGFEVTGCCCDKCSKELIAPYQLFCEICKQVALEGEAADTYETAWNKIHRDPTKCPPYPVLEVLCYKHCQIAFRHVLKKAASKIRELAWHSHGERCAALDRFEQEAREEDADPLSLLSQWQQEARETAAVLWQENTQDLLAAQQDAIDALDASIWQWREKHNCYDLTQVKELLEVYRKNFYKGDA